MDTISNNNEIDKILLLKQRGVQSNYSVPKFEKALIIYNDYSYYIDQTNKDVYFLGSLLQSTGNNGKINVEFCLEKYSIQDNVRIYKNCFILTQSFDNHVQYVIDDKGYINITKKGNGRIKRIELSKLNSNEKWWDY